MCAIEMFSKNHCYWKIIKCMALSKNENQISEDMFDWSERF